MNLEKIELRKSIIKLHEKKKKQMEIASLLDVPQTVVSYWIRRYKKTNSLDDMPKSGHPKRLNQTQINNIKLILLDKPPKRFGGDSSGWTTRMAIQYIFDNYNVKYGMRQIQKLFHNFGLNLITPRIEHTKTSEAARKVYRMDFKKNSKKNIWIAPSLISTK
jgi:transposase